MPVIDMRTSPRYNTIARARIPGVLEGDNLVKNLSITGCCMECTAFCDIKPNTQYDIVIQPEAAADIGEFDLHVECRWIRNGDYYSDVGFLVIASPKGKRFQRYVDYLTYHSTLA
jgi:hypothetical protein